jgi:hypothetical protein
MQHTVEIADTQGKTMKISVTAETIGFGGSWRAIDKGMICHNSGSVEQSKIKNGFDLDVHLTAGGEWGINLSDFISWGTVNDQGTGKLLQPWVLSLTPGKIEWSIV